jgi:hypothetical protein
MLIVVNIYSNVCFKLNGCQIIGGYISTLLASSLVESTSIVQGKICCVNMMPWTNGDHPKGVILKSWVRNCSAKYVKLERYLCEADQPGMRNNLVSSQPIFIDNLMMITNRCGWCLYGVCTHKTTNDNVH